uniref:NACHT domain-containing protein n=1 Tax=Strigamia maritima TaxID=126957 RepID=T1IQR6_STRMM
MSSSLKIKWDAASHWGSLALTLLGIGTEVACDWLVASVCDLEPLKDKNALSWTPEMRIAELVKTYKQTLEGSKGLSLSQQATLFPIAGLPQIDRFDIPLVYGLVRHVYPIPDGNADPSWSGWTKDPPAHQQGGIHEIIRLRALFAELRSTSPDEVAEEDFRRMWMRLRAALLRLCVESRKSDLERKLIEKRSNNLTEEKISELRSLIGAEDDNKREDKKADKIRGADISQLRGRTDSILQGIKQMDAATRRASVGKKAFGGRQPALLTKFRAAGHKVLEDVRQQAARAKNKLGPGHADPKDCPKHILRPMNKVSEFLKTRYKEIFSHYQPLGWFERVRIPLEQIYIELMPIEDSAGRRDPCTPMELFASSDQPGRKVLVEGEFSSGKSTVCRRLALDWASGKLPHFQIVFFIQMKHANGLLLETLYKDVKKISGSSVNKDEFFTYLRYHQKEVLLLLDGTDEVENDVLTDYIDLLKNTQSNRNDDILEEEDEEEDDDNDNNGLLNCVGLCSILITARPITGSIFGIDARYRLQAFTRDWASQFLTRQVATRTDKDTAEATLRLLLRRHGTCSALLHPVPLAFLCDLVDADWPPKETTLTAVFATMVERLCEEFCARHARFCKSHNFEGHGISDHLDILGEIAWKALKDGKLIIPVRALNQQYGTKKMDTLFRLGFLGVHESESALGSTKQAEFVAKPLAEFYAAWWLASKAQKETEDLKPLLREIHVADFFYQMTSTKRLHNSNIFQFAFGLLSDHPEAAVKLLKSLCEDAHTAARDHELFPWWCSCYSCIDEAGDASITLASALLPFLERKILSLDFDRGRNAGTRGLVQVMRAQQSSGRGYGVRFESGEALKELLSDLGEDRYRYDLVELHIDSWECWQEDEDFVTMCARLLTQFRCRVLRLSIPPMFCAQALHESVLPLLAPAGITTLALDFHLDQFAAPTNASLSHGDQEDSNNPKIAMDDVVRAVARAVSTCRELRYLRVQFAACPDVQFECSSRALQNLNEAIDARGPRLTVDLSWPFVE